MTRNQDIAYKRILERSIGGACDTFGHIPIARYWPVNDFWLLVSFEGLARPFQRVWWRFVGGSREI